LANDQERLHPANISRKDLFCNGNLTQRRKEATMNEIVELLQQKAGMSQDDAQRVAQLVVQHILSRVPAEFQGPLESVLGSGTANAEGQQAASGSGVLGELMGMASGLLEGEKG
jgi:hypothetical protein